MQSVWRWFASKQGYGHVVVSDGNAILEIKFLAQTQDLLKPPGTLLWVAHREAEVPDDAQNKWCFHAASLSSSIKVAWPKG